MESTIRWPNRRKILAGNANSLSFLVWRSDLWGNLRILVSPKMAGTDRMSKGSMPGRVLDSMSRVGIDRKTTSSNGQKMCQLHIQRIRRAQDRTKIRASSMCSCGGRTSLVDSR
jgi:hypothetical protein